MGVDCSWSSGQREGKNRREFSRGDTWRDRQENRGVWEWWLLQLILTTESKVDIPPVALQTWVCLSPFVLGCYFTDFWCGGGDAWKALINRTLLFYTGTFACRGVPTKFDKVWGRWVTNMSICIALCIISWVLSAGMCNSLKNCKKNLKVCQAAKLCHPLEDRRTHYNRWLLSG